MHIARKVAEEFKKLCAFASRIAIGMRAIEFSPYFSIFT